MSERDLEGKSVLLTGASTGIGRATALALGKRGATLYLAGRSAQRTEAVAAEVRAAGSASVQFIQLSLEDLGSVRACAGEFLALNSPLDVLINNAGLAGSRGLTRDGFELLFGVNYLGHFLLTELLKAKLIDSARGKPQPGRIVNVSSLAHRRVRQIDWDAVRRSTRHLTTQPEYGFSKLCNILHAKELARRLEGENVHTYALHPGIIASNIWREVPWPLRPLMTRFMKPNEDGANSVVFCATSRQAAAESGLYYDGCRAAEPSALARDEVLARELFERSLRWTALPDVNTAPRA